MMMTSSCTCRTLSKPGHGLCNPAAVKILIEEGAERIDELLGWGKPHSTKLSFELENPHTRSRRLHAHGESTAREILRTLAQKLESLKPVSLAPFTFVTELRTQDGKVRGISLLDEKGAPQQIACSAVLLATGGCGQIFSNTTNPDSATADGIALAFRAGAEVGDMEFVQFHPTALCMKKVPRFPLPETSADGGRLPSQLRTQPFYGKVPPAGRARSRRPDRARHRS